jgi:predicted sugar kinase
VSGEQAQKIEAIDLTVGMAYREFPSHDWFTVKDISYSFKRGEISGVDITHVEGGGLSTGAYTPLYVKQVAS